MKRDAQDIKILLDWLNEARSFREKRAMIALIEGLVGELKMAVDELSKLQ